MCGAWGGGLGRPCCPTAFDSEALFVSNKKTAPKGSSIFTGGEGGIRTLEGLLSLTPLAGERFQPLSHLSDPVFCCASLDTASFGIVGSGTATLLINLTQGQSAPTNLPLSTSPADWESAFNHSATSPIVSSAAPTRARGLNLTDGDERRKGASSA